MANEVTLFQGGSMPAHVAEAQANTNIVPRSTVNALTFEGKVWTINLEGKKTKLTKTNADGEEENVQIFTGILLDYTKDRGREYYAGKYDPKKPAAPDCWSEDGKKPHDNVPVNARVSLTCAACQNSKKNSAMTDAGKGTVACSQFRKIALVPAARLGGFPPLRLRIKITSDYDKDGQDKHPNWYGFQQYLDFLVANGVRFTGSLPTKIKFDNTVAYPKLLFAPGKAWLEPDALEQVKEMAMSEAVKDLLAATYAPGEGGTKPLPEDDGEETEVAAAVPAQVAPKKKAKPAPAPEAEEEEEEEAPAPAPTTTEKPKAAPAPAAEEEEEEEEQTAEQIAAAKRAAAKAANATAASAAVGKATAKATANKAASVAAAAEEEEEEEAEAVPPAKTPKAPKAAAAAAGKATAAKAPVNAPAEVADMLEGWDDE